MTIKKKFRLQEAAQSGDWEYKARVGDFQSMIGPDGVVITVHVNDWNKMFREVEMDFTFTVEELEQERRDLRGTLGVEDSYL